LANKIMKDENLKLLDVRQSIEKQANTARSISFSAEGWSIPSGGHLQGIQRVDISEKTYFIISGSSSEQAYFIVVGETEGGYGILQKNVISTDPYRHAGGIQVMGNYLAVGVEDNEKRNTSIVYLFDIGKPDEPVGKPLVEIHRKGEEKLATAGAIAVVKHKTHHLLIVGTWDSDTLDFYRSNNAALDSADCKFSYWLTWNKHEATRDDWCDNNWGSYPILPSAGGTAIRI
jgi:hypothetical protein